jgi:8-oxo-dGTP pyrophosphatase MutT (NUDIX family)
MDELKCDNQLRQRLCTNLGRFRRVALTAAGYRKAAVALTVVDYRQLGGLSGLRVADDRAGALILTRRAGGLNRHAGQWALPGGLIDAGETTIQAALRELQEEVGLQCHPTAVLGCLDDFVTRSGYHIVPVVVWGGQVARLQPDSREVASIHRISCVELMRPDGPVLEPVSIPGEGKGEILYMPVGDSYIASPTAAILYQFRAVALEGREVRVSHYEQPRFAWR